MLGWGRARSVNTFVLFFFRNNLRRGVDVAMKIIECHPFRFKRAMQVTRVLPETVGKVLSTTSHCYRKNLMHVWEHMH